MSKLSAPPPPPLEHPVAYAGPPRLFSCCECGAQVAHTSRIVSTAYRGHAGRALLFSETRNITLDPPSILLMDSGAYTIQEFICSACEAYLGWKFLRAHDSPERWKDGLFILELDLVLDQPAPEDGWQMPQQQQQRSFAGQGQDAMGLHKRTMSGEGKPPMGARQGRRSMQILAKPLPGRRIDEVDERASWRPK